MTIVEDVIKTIEDERTPIEYAARPDNFKKDLERFLEMMMRYNMNVRFIRYEIRRSIAIGGFPGHNRFMMDIKNPNLDSGISDEKTKNQIAKEYHNFFGETIYAEDIQRPMGAPDLPHIKRVETPEEKEVDLTDWKTVPNSLGVSPTAKATTVYEEPVDTTNVYKYPPYQPEITITETSEKQRIIQFESGNRLTLHNITSFDNTKNYLRFNCDEGFVLINPEKVEYHIIKNY